MMKIQRDVTDRNLLLDQLRKAVTLQIELWDVRLALSDTLGRALNDVGAQRTIDPKTIELFLNQQRNAAALEAELAHVAHSMCCVLQCDSDWIASQVEAIAITADSGLELADADLDEFLGVGPERTKCARALEPVTIQ
jgi:hypothetical protein